jgi:hypothetical protein
MTAARAQLVDASLTRWYQCVTRCVRRAFLLGEGQNSRKEWIENRFEELYAQLVDYTARLFRQGKASISAELAGIFERLECTAQNWQNRMEKLRDGRLLGRVFATTRAKLLEVAERFGVPRPTNVAGCPAS